MARAVQHVRAVAGEHRFVHGGPGCIRAGRQAVHAGPERDRGPDPGLPRTDRNLDFERVRDGEQLAGRRERRHPNSHVVQLRTPAAVRVQRPTASIAVAVVLRALIERRPKLRHGRSYK